MTVCNLSVDGLPLERVHSWVNEKHRYLRHYVGITAGTRKKYIPPPAERGGAAYVDLYCGPGRSVIDETGIEVDGSPIVAAKEATRSGVPFSAYHLSDLDPINSSSAVTRLRDYLRSVNDPTPVFEYAGPALEIVQSVIEQLKAGGLHLFFMDPYAMQPMPFALMTLIAALQRPDLLVHFSVSDFQRNLPNALRDQGGTHDRIFEAFAPGWRSVVDSNTGNGAKQRSQFMEHWTGLIQTLGFESVQPSTEFRLITGDNNQRLYWLVLLSKHGLARNFWAKINPNPQGELFA